MAYRFEFAPRMLDQADAIYESLLATDPQRAAVWFDELYGTIETLKTFPLRCPVVAGPDGSTDETRLLLHGNRRSPYLIFFSIRGDTIRILAIRHSRQADDTR